MNSLISTSGSELSAAVVPALYYDGRNAISHTVGVRVTQAEDAFELRIEGDGQLRREPLTRKSTAGRVGRARHLLALADGGTLEILDAAGFDAALRAAGHQDGQRLVRWLERSWPVALAAMVALVFGTWAFMTWGIPALANRAVMLIPREVDAHIGTQGLSALDRTVFKPSTLPAFRQAQLRSLFDQIKADAGAEGRNYQLELRHGGGVGANAFALPAGIVVMTDELVELAHNDDELRGVLAHETGHLVHRHAMRQLLQHSAGALVMVGIVGDVSAASMVAAAIPGVLLNAAYSRDFEREADGFAVQWMRQHQVPPGRLADLLTRLSANAGSAKGSLLASHPGLAERVQLAGGATGADPEAAGKFLDSGNALLNKRHYDAAIADFDKALQSDPASSMAYADRAIAEIWKYQNDLAVKDLDAAEQLSGSNAIVFHGRGLLAYRAGDFATAVVAFSKAVDINENDKFALEWRAYAHARLGESDSALADTAAVLAGRPDWADIYVLRARLFWSQGKPELAMHDAAALEVAHPEDAATYEKAARIYTAINDRPHMMWALDRAVELRPDAQTYVARANNRLPDDLKGRRSDIATALTLDPHAPAALRAEAALQRDQRDYPRAIAALDKLLARDDGDIDALTLRVIVNARWGRQLQSQQDLDRAVALATTAGEQNNLCWMLAIAGTALDTALAECDAGLKAQPMDFHILDSRGMALLKLGRYPESVQAYDQALKLIPDAESALYARGLAELHLGMKVEGDADISAARAIKPEIDQRFASYGLKP